MGTYHSSLYCNRRKGMKRRGEKEIIKETKRQRKKEIQIVRSPDCESGNRNRKGERRGKKNYSDNEMTNMLKVRAIKRQTYNVKKDTKYKVCIHPAGNAYTDNGTERL